MNMNRAKLMALAERARKALVREEPLAHPASAHVVELDVREDLRSGGEPFAKILAAVRGLAAADVLRLRTIFEPVPLFIVLGKRGFVHESQEIASEDWVIWFWKPANAESAESAESAAPADELPRSTAEIAGTPTIELDVRGLLPPEPLMRTLAALETLAPGDTLLQLNSRVPQLLFPLLAERGFAWSVDESQPDVVRVRICHAR
jgi:uncharacterized protein (DUF2249 family)